MNLTRFQGEKGYKKKIAVAFFAFLFFILIVVIVRTYALYEVQKEYDAIEGNVPAHMDDFDVKVALTIDGAPSTTFPEKGSDKTIDSITCDKGATATWDYEKWDIIVHNVKQTKTKCQVNFVTKYIDSVLNGNDPVLAENLIPITIENQNGENVVKKASQKDAWYDYTKKQWANAVILKDENETYKAGDVISEDKIESYFVWIPKFDYQIFNTTNYQVLDGINASWDASKHGIQVRFNSKSTTDTSSECKSPNKSGDIGTCSIGKWMTHPAFVDGFEGKTGMWVGKFETSRNKNISTQDNETNSEAIQIKPSVNSWRNIQMANAFYSSYYYQRNLDSHMMKNTEWGAVAYLTQSIYGKCDSLNNCDDVRVNNSDYKTGYASVKVPTCGYSATNMTCNEYGANTSVTRPWNDVETLGIASTTGNVSGIYDMSGGAWEYVMGVMMTENGRLISGLNDSFNSNFVGILSDTRYGQDSSKTEWSFRDGGVPFPESKYFDAYQNNNTDDAYGRMILGDATGEFGPFGTAQYENQTRHIHSWFADEAWFVYLDQPWFRRGGQITDGTGAGVFAFFNMDGRAYSPSGFRVVLSP